MRRLLVTLILAGAATPALADDASKTPVAPTAPKAEGDYGGVIPGQSKKPDTGKKPKKPPPKGTLSWIGFEAKDGGSQVFLQSVAPFEASQRVENGALIVSLTGVTRLGQNTWRPIDTRFFDTDGNILDGRGITWTDTLGASNAKYSYYAPQIDVNHEAHVEAPEVGTHFISIQNQPGCTVGNVAVAGVNQKKAGPQTVPVRVTQGMKKKGTFTVFVDVTCTATQ